MNKKKRRIVIAIASVLCITMAAVAFYMFAGKEQGDIATTWTSNQLASYASENSGTKVPGYSHLYFPADSEKIPITLWNPEGNECLFRFTLTLEEENDILYTSDFIEPGMALEEITLNHSLSPGDYRLLIQIEPYTMDKTTPLNRANVTADLTVQ